MRASLILALALAAANADATCWHRFDDQDHVAQWSQVVVPSERMLLAPAGGGAVVAWVARVYPQRVMFAHLEAAEPAARPGRPCPSKNSSCTAGRCEPRACVTSSDCEDVCVPSPGWAERRCFRRGGTCKP